jgi:DNA primase
MPHLHEEFDKKLYLFGLNVAKNNIIKYQKAIVVEGQFDTACSHTHGYGVTVGVLGSALSMFHVNILARYCSEIFLVFDMDESGFKSLARTMYMYKYYGLDSMGIKFIPVILPKHKDPDEFLRKEDSKEYMKLLVEAKQRVLEKGSIGYYNILKQLHPQIVVATSKGK